MSVLDVRYFAEAFVVLLVITPNQACDVNVALVPLGTPLLGPGRDRGDYRVC